MAFDWLLIRLVRAQNVVNWWWTLPRAGEWDKVEITLYIEALKQYQQICNNNNNNDKSGSSSSSRSISSRKWLVSKKNVESHIILQSNQSSEIECINYFWVETPYQLPKSPGFRVDYLTIFPFVDDNQTSKMD